MVLHAKHLVLLLLALAIACGPQDGPAHATVRITESDWGGHDVRLDWPEVQDPAIHKIRIWTSWHPGYIEDYARTDDYRMTKRNRSGFSFYSIKAVGLSWVDVAYKDNDGWQDKTRIDFKLPGG